MALIDSNHKIIALVKSSLLDKHRRNDTATLIDLSLKDGSRSPNRRIGLQIKHLRLHYYGIKKIVDPFPFLSGYLHELRLTAPFLGNEIIF